MSIVKTQPRLQFYGSRSSLSFSFPYLWANNHPSIHPPLPSFDKHSLRFWCVQTLDQALEIQLQEREKEVGWGGAKDGKTCGEGTSWGNIIQLGQAPPVNSWPSPLAHDPQDLPLLAQPPASLPPGSNQSQLPHPQGPCLEMSPSPGMSHPPGSEASFTPHTILLSTICMVPPPHFLMVVDVSTVLLFY